MLECRKCNKKFPMWVKINGKAKNLNNRKFCLECSPFGSHNTRKVILDNHCDSIYCPKCCQIKPITEFYSRNKYRLQSYCKKCFNTNCTQRWINKKIEIVRDFGGKCSKCGYSKNLGALSFHHLFNKEFSWNKMRLLSKEKMQKELSKCILVCANCHAEIHYPQLTDI
jgi:hypothetical protein